MPARKNDNKRKRNSNRNRRQKKRKNKTIKHNKTKPNRNVDNKRYAVSNVCFIIHGLVIIIDLLFVFYILLSGNY